MSKMIDKVIQCLCFDTCTFDKYGVCMICGRKKEDKEVKTHE